MTKLLSGIFAAFACVFALKLAAATVTRPLPRVTGDELAVWQVVAEVIGRENASRPYKLWYIVSDFTAASFIASAIDDPDRDQFCGLSGAEAQAMISELKAVNAAPVALETSVAKTAGLRVAYAKDRRLRYFALSRVVFDPEGTRAWLSVELNGARGSIVRLDKVDGQWNKTSRCAGWYIPE
ncbi:MAG TPA: hypothetical protein VGO61_04555 [Steroidobacteraceae bacterium]|jgi:hypothetical protein|nr:hypothetical protein [Steroidobacteraceae bacterium]